MITEKDEGKGLIKVYWKDVHARVAKIDPIFADLVNALSPGRSYPVFLAYYPYGELKGDTKDLFIPKIKGGIYRLSDPSAPKDVIQHLGYGKNDSPFGMVLEKSLEVYIDLPNENITIPYLIYKPGTFFPFSRILSRKNNRTYTPNGILTISSGARSIFMLPNIGCNTQHSRLQLDLNIQKSSPKSLYEHWYLFKEIINSKQTTCDWRSCLLYFSEKWVQMLLNDPAWLSLKMYLHELAWRQYEYERNRFYYNFIFSFIQKKRNLKPNPYLADTVAHLLTTTLGATPGYAPALDEEQIPLEIIQKAYVESYGLKKYYPTIMQPVHYVFEKETHPIYYSLNYPSTQVFSPKSRKISSTLLEMRELSHILKIFIEELRKENSFCSDTIMSEVARKAEFFYFHNEKDRYQIIHHSKEILNLDKRFNIVSAKCKVRGAKFAADASFLRGCIAVKNQFKS